MELAHSGDEFERFKEFEAVLETFAEGILILDKNGVIIFANSAAVRIAGAPKSTMVGRSYHDPRWSPKRSNGSRIRPEETPTAIALKTAKPVYDMEISVTSPDGRRVSVITNTAPLFNERRQVIGVLVSLTDITDRKKMESALERKTAEFEAVFRALPDLFFRFDYETRYLDFRANRFSELYVPPERFLGKRIRDVLPPDVASKLEADVRKAIDTQSLVTTEYSLTINGAVNYYESRTTPALLGEAICIVRNVTERVKAEQALRKSELHYRQLVEGASDVITRLDLYPEPHYSYISPAILAMMGYAPEEYYADSELGFRTVYPEDLPKVGHLVRGEYEPGEKALFRLVRKDGRIIWTEVSAAPIRDQSGTLIAHEAIIRDITERVRIEEALRESETRFRTIFESAAVGIGLTNLEGFIIRANSVLQGVFERGSEELSKIRINELTHPEDWPAEEVMLSELTLGKRDSYQIEKRVLRKSGAYLWTRLTVSIVRSPEGKPQYYLGILEDISGWKVIERERERGRELAGALNALNTEIASTLDAEEMIRRATVEGARAIGAESAFVALHERAHWEIRHAYGLPDRYAHLAFDEKDAPYGIKAREEKRLVEVTGVFPSGRHRSPVLEQLGIRSAIVVPLIVRETLIGTLYFGFRSAPLGFSEIEMDFATKLGTLLSLALENARLYESERYISRTLQEALLTVPEVVPGVVFGHLYHSATEAALVGGDFFDLFQLDKGRVGVVIGDVSGKGIGGTALTTLVANTIRAYAYEGYKPATICEKLNDVIFKVAAPGSFVTAFLGILDTNDGWLTYCSGGHLPILVKRARTGDIASLGVRSPILGALAGMSCHEGGDRLEEGDMLVLYTDGVVEARSDSDLFGQGRLVEVLRAPVGTKEMPKHVFDAVMEFTGGSLADDVAILTISFEGRNG
ncbi:MAG: SpoIIE family protein phosphatase [Candidatus Aquicultorales bacterium]